MLAILLDRKWCEEQFEERNSVSEIANRGGKCECCTLTSHKNNNKQVCNSMRMDLCIFILYSHGSSPPNTNLFLFYNVFWLGINILYKAIRSLHGLGHGCDI